MSEKKIDLNRREFLKGAAIVTGVGFLAGCAPKSADEMPDTTAESIEAPVVSEDWLGEEPEVGTISETVESEVIVIGAGTGGAYVAASLLEKGVDVILLEKRDTVSTLRNDWGCIGSKWQLEEGVELDPATIIHYHSMYSANRIDQRLPHIWANESGAAVTWIGELLESRGANFYYEGGYEPHFENHATHHKFPTGHSADFPNGKEGAQLMQEYIEELGGEYRFNTSFIKFEYEGKKVTAVIAQDQDGNYIRFVGEKGIVLSTGGYQGNPDMMHALQPAEIMTITPPMSTSTCGDGIKACLWMGAAMDEVPASVTFDRMGLLPNETPKTMTIPGFFWLGSQPWMKVNLLGERFANESTTYDFILHAAAKQPSATYCCIMDSNWFDQVTQFETMGCSRIYPFPNGSPNDVYKTGGLESTGTDFEVIREEWTAILNGLIESGHLQQADTPEELAEKLNIPADTFAASLNRYNELAENGVDEDFFKDAYRLLPLTAPPYYGIRVTGWHLCTLDGIRIDTQMRPMDEQSVPFEGLHVIGDTSGSYFAHTYPSLLTGYANGRTLTFARRVARILAGESVNL